MLRGPLQTWPPIPGLFGTSHTEMHRIRALMGFFITGDHLRFATREVAAPLRPPPLKPYSSRWALCYRMCLPLPTAVCATVHVYRSSVSPLWMRRGTRIPLVPAPPGEPAKRNLGSTHSHNKPGKSCPAENFGDGGAVVVKTEATAEEIGDLLA